jgi:hypothetical protein
MADLWGPLYEWDGADELQIADVDALPLTSGLRQQLKTWGEDWKDASGHNYGRLRPEVAAKLRRDGEGIAAAIRRELGDDFAVLHVEVSQRGAPTVSEPPGR